MYQLSDNPSTTYWFIYEVEPARKIFAADKIMLPSKYRQHFSQWFIDMYKVVEEIKLATPILLGKPDVK